MSIKLSFHIGTLELGIAAFTHADGRRVSLYDPQIALGHLQSSAGKGLMACANQTAPLPKFSYLCILIAVGAIMKQF
jgi:hypothetical protein